LPRSLRALTRLQTRPDPIFGGPSESTAICCFENGMVMTFSWRKGVNLWSFACQHRGVLTEDFERTRAILRGHDEGCLLMLDLIFSVGSIGFRMRARCDRFSGACETDQRKAKARHNRWDAKLRSYATRSAVMPRSPISISATPVSPIRGASRQN